MEPAADSADEKAEGGLAELRRKMRTQRRLRLVTLISLAAMVLLVLPVFFGVRAMSTDPVFASLDRLQVDSWAETAPPKDQEFGSALCIEECSFREREAASDRPFPETATEYSEALSKAGWTQWKAAACEKPARPEEESHSCWRLDELTLDLFVGLPGCAVDQFAAELNPLAAEEPVEPQEPGECAGSSVRIKVQNTIVDTRGKTDTAPGPLGETPDTVLPDTDSIFPTPQAS
ncbi:hypothetical protein [Actinoplanes derwentensis]|uniref:Integrin beta 3 n=1 Tax=Actinoplanes derwentensis TaxID=113562 RepID=A0A1H2DA46_9ACTN|nr:hypothetical protein [Actinoplanes derwentensis]SDT79603.1 integrin beta 3 [Actinoplanes derwentensis]